MKVGPNWETRQKQGAREAPQWLNQVPPVRANNTKLSGKKWHPCKSVILVTGFRAEHSKFSGKTTSTIADPRQGRTRNILSTWRCQQWSQEMKYSRPRSPAWTCSIYCLKVRTILPAHKSKVSLKYSLGILQAPFLGILFMAFQLYCQHKETQGMAAFAWYIYTQPNSRLRHSVLYIYATMQKSMTFTYMLNDTLPEWFPVCTAIFCLRTQGSSSRWILTPLAQFSLVFLTEDGPVDNLFLNECCQQRTAHNRNTQDWVRTVRATPEL